MYAEPGSLVVLCLLLIIIFSKNIFKFTAKYEPVKEEFPIEYPMEPMFENYISIIEEIKSCQTQKDLKSVYIRILIFEGCYSDSASFVSELMAEYFDVEKAIC